MYWWLFTTLFAAEPAPEPVAPAAAEVRRVGSRRYPKRLYPDRSRSLTCDVRVTLDARGVPDAVDTSACAPELAPWADRFARKDRWEAPVPAGTQVPVTLRFPAPADTFVLAAPDTWRFRETEPCQVRLQVPDSGQGAWVRASSDGCAPSLPVALPAATGRAPTHPPRLCPVSFVSDDAGEVGELWVFRCAPSLWARAREIVAGVTWPAAGPHVVLLSLGGEAPPPAVSDGGDGG